MHVLNSPRHGVLTTRHWVSSFDDPSVTGEGLLCYRPVPIVCGGSWICRLSDTNSSVPAVAHTSADNGPMNGDTLVVRRAMRGVVVGSEGDDVEMLCMMGQGDDPL